MIFTHILFNKSINFDTSFLFNFYNNSFLLMDLKYLHNISNS